jgi:hypothetical protein
LVFNLIISKTCWGVPACLLVSPHTPGNWKAPQSYVSKVATIKMSGLFFDLPLKAVDLFVTD